MVDPVHLVLGEGLPYRGVERDGALQASAEGLLDDDPDPGAMLAIGHPRCDARLGQSIDGLLVETGRDGEIEKVPAPARKCGIGFRYPFPERVVRGRVVQRTRDIVEMGR